MPHTKIVIVEDESEVAQLARRLLEDFGYTVVGCVSAGEEALRVVEKGRPDLVLVDIGLEGPIDGIEAATQIRFRLNVPVIYFTGDARPSTVERAKLAEPIGYILKPFNPEELRTTIETALYQFRKIRKRADEALQQAERQYQSLFENALEGIYQSTPDGRFIAANTTLARMLGYESQAELLSSVTAIERQLYIEEESRREFKRVLHEKGEARRFESRIRRKDGTQIWTSENARAVRDEAGQLLYYEGFVEDITERRRAEAAMRESERKYRALIETTGTGYVILDSEGRVLDANPEYVRLSGHGALEEIVDRSVTEWTAQHDLARNAAEVKKCLERGFVRNVEIDYVNREGVCVPIELSATTLRTTEGVKIVTLCRDITERKWAEEERARMELQLRQALKLEAIGQLATGIAHEINTPTQYVGDNTRFLQDAFADLSKVLKSYGRLLEMNRQGGVDPELVAKVEAEIQEIDLGYLTEEIPNATAQSLEGVKRVAAIVRAMKEFSHPSGEEKQAIDLNHAIESTITVCRNEWKYVADMVTDFDPDLPPVPCLPGELNQVILNLIINASQTIADVVGDRENGKGRITVHTRRDGNWAEIRVSDTGKGIPEEHRGKIFTPFFTTKEVGKGTGQGLAISHSVIVGKHGGTIEFKTDLGKGTTFIIRLPLDPDLS